MAKGYLVANLRVADQEIFKEFSSVALPLIEKYGEKLLAIGADVMFVENGKVTTQTVVGFTANDFK